MQNSSKFVDNSKINIYSLVPQIDQPVALCNAWNKIRLSKKKQTFSVLFSQRIRTDVLTGLRIFALDKCQTVYTPQKSVLMRLKDATFASKLEQTFHTFLE